MGLLKKFNSELKLNHEGISSSFGNVEFNLEDEILAAEEEGNVEETLDEATDTSDVITEANDVIDELEEKIEEGKAVVEAVEEKTEEASEVVESTDGEAEATTEDEVDVSDKIDENGDVKVEEVEAVQEALKSAIRKTGIDLTFIGSDLSLSREDIASNRLFVYKQNLEDLAKIKDSVKNMAKTAWAKIVEMFKWLQEKIASLLPTKINRFKAVLKKMNEVGAKDISTDYFNKNLATRYAAIGNVFDGKDLPKVFSNLALDVKVDAVSLSNLNNFNKKLFSDMLKVQSSMDKGAESLKDVAKLMSAAAQTQSRQNLFKSMLIDRKSNEFFTKLESKFFTGNAIESKVKQDLLSNSNDKLNGYAINGVKFANSNITINILASIDVGISVGNGEIKSSVVLPTVKSTTLTSSVPEKTTFSATSDNIREAILNYIKVGGITNEAFSLAKKNTEEMMKTSMEPLTKDAGKVKVKAIGIMSKLAARSANSCIRSVLSNYKTLNSDLYNFVGQLASHSIKLANPTESKK